MKDIKTHLQELDILGYTLIEDVLTEDRVRYHRRRLAEIWDIQKQETAAAGIDIASLPENNIVRAPLLYGREFLDVAADKRITDIIKMVLGDYFILSQQNGVFVYPSITHSQNKWHRDLSHMNYVSDPPLAINAFYCLTDFNVKTGATRLLPGTHKSKEVPTQEYMDTNEVSIQAKAGSVFLFNTMLFHATGINTSDDVRIGLNHIYSNYILKQQIDIPTAFLEKYKVAPQDQFTRMLLGIDSSVPTSVIEYRKKRKDAYDSKQHSI